MTGQEARTALLEQTKVVYKRAGKSYRGKLVRELRSDKGLPPSFLFRGNIAGGKESFAGYAKPAELFAEQ